MRFRAPSLQYKIMSQLFEHSCSNIKSYQLLSLFRRNVILVPFVCPVLSILIEECQFRTYHHQFYLDVLGIWHRNRYDNNTLNHPFNLTTGDVFCLLSESTFCLIEEENYFSFKWDGSCPKIGTEVAIVLIHNPNSCFWSQVVRFFHFW